MTVFNGEQFIADAISSCLNQTYPNFELIIVNDGSTDNTDKAIGAFNDTRIRYIRNHTNLGQSYSRNLGIRNSLHDYIAIMDADDMAHPERLETQLSFLESHPEISICCSHAEIIDENNHVIGYKRTPLDEVSLKLKLLFECPIIHPTVMWRKLDFVDNNLWYDEFYVYAQDYDLWSRATDKVSLGIVPQPLLRFRFRHSKSISYSKKEIQIKYAKIISERNLRTISPIAPFLSKYDCLICKVILYRTIIKSDYLSNMRDLKIEYFRRCLFDGTRLPLRFKKYLRNILIAVY